MSYKEKLSEYISQLNNEKFCEHIYFLIKDLERLFNP